MVRPWPSDHCREFRSYYPNLILSNVGSLQDGSLVITLNKTTDADSHGLGYLVSPGTSIFVLRTRPHFTIAAQGGMIQSWNKFCFTGGRIEAAVSLPGDSKVSCVMPLVPFSAQR